MINVGVVGYGYWGPNLVRNFAETPGIKPVAVSDLREARLNLAKSRYPNLTITADYRSIIESPDTDAIAIATPVSTHYDIALEALKAGKHVFIEKPVTDNSEHAMRLIDEAASRNLLLMVDHTFVYTGAVRKIKELISAGQLGEVFYYDSVRINLGLFQHDVNVLWDLAVHDLSILNYLFAERPCAVSATGVSHVPGEPENIGYITLFFETRLMAHI
ncbi:MAG: Gfo/Idh/MocA family oxidoreductase, partial [Acidobacteriia bacterium]|nr:Gfo/Idh/MocA family oxidoreductase [Terriglobia bacterium]